jgi:hypothetical protein
MHFRCGQKRGLGSYLVHDMNKSHMHTLISS